MGTLEVYRAGENMLLDYSSGLYRIMFLLLLDSGLKG